MRRRYRQDSAQKSSFSAESSRIEGAKGLIPDQFSTIIETSKNWPTAGLVPLDRTPMPKPPAILSHLDGCDHGLLAAVAAGQARLAPEQALAIYYKLPLTTLGRFADARARLIHGDAIRTYVIDRNINYTNVCNAKCTFCAFRRNGDEADAYTLEPEVIYQKVAELSAIGGTQILMQGGMNPALPLTWYTDLLRGIKSRFPHIHIHAFSPPEFIEFVHFFDPPGATLRDKIRWVMVRLRDAGLDSLPGGGGAAEDRPWQV